MNIEDVIRVQKIQESTSDDSCSVIERELEDIQKILYREDDQNE